VNEESKDSAKEVQPINNRQRVFSSQDLLQGCREVLIVHGEETYRLRLTRNDKLILHK